MSGDLQCFEGPPSINNATNECLPPSDALSGNEKAGSASFDILSRSPTKNKPNVSITSLSSMEFLNRGNGDTFTDEPDTSTAITSFQFSNDNYTTMDFAMRPQDNKNNNENNTESTEAIAEINQHEESTDLLDFGGRTNQSSQSTITQVQPKVEVNRSSSTLVQSQSSTEESFTHPDLFEVDHTPIHGEANLLDHRDSFAPVVEQHGGGELLNLFASSTTAESSSLGADVEKPLSVTNSMTMTADPVDAFSLLTSAQASSHQRSVDPFSDVVTLKTNIAHNVPSTQDKAAIEREIPQVVTTKATIPVTSNVTADDGGDTSFEGMQYDQSPLGQKDADQPASVLQSGHVDRPDANRPFVPYQTTKDQNVESYIISSDATTNDKAQLQVLNALYQKERLPPSSQVFETSIVSERSQHEQSTKNSRHSPNHRLQQNTEEAVDAPSIHEDATGEDKKENDNADISSSPHSNSDTTIAKKAQSTPRKTPMKLPPPSPAPDTSDEATLKQHIKVLEKQLHAAHTSIMQFQHHDDIVAERPGDAVMVELQSNLQQEMNRRAEAEDKMRLAQSQYQKLVEEFKTFKLESESLLAKLTNDRESLTTEKDTLLKEVEQIRIERDEQARKEMSLTTRLNAAKKLEAVKANAAEHYEDQVEHLQKTASDYKASLESMTAERDQLAFELSEWKTYAEKRTKQLENALNDEKKLNDERKKKMKGFVEAKTEEVRAAKAEYISLQTELDQTSHSLQELNQRYKQLHAQWVQSQTRNRELQRDMTKLKKDSEKMLKAGGTLEARLSRSAQESEDHKNKRIQAKHELMSVLSQLEAERAVNARLQEAMRMTFTPKALSQQQTINEALDEFEGALQRLSIRLGRPLPPPPSQSSNELLNDSLGDQQSDNCSVLGINDDVPEDSETSLGFSSSTSLSENTSNKVLRKLEEETQRVSKNIVSFSISVERMHTLLDGAGPRNCTDVITTMFLTANSGHSEETRAMTEYQQSTRGARYR